MADNQAARWQRLEEWFRNFLGKNPNMEAILFLIGVRELGSPPREFEKEEKMELIHIAICRLLSQSGYYELSHLDQDGWPHWKSLKELPHQDMFSQVHLLREHILTYFEEEEIFTA
ncbi:MAG: hypothetical protein AB8H47_26700 [Bacteroidia bacterium]